MEQSNTPADTVTRRAYNAIPEFRVAIDGSSWLVWCDTLPDWAAESWGWGCFGGFENAAPVCWAE